MFQIEHLLVARLWRLVLRFASRSRADGPGRSGLGVPVLVCVGSGAVEASGGGGIGDCRGSGGGDELDLGTGGREVVEAEACVRAVVVVRRSACVRPASGWYGSRASCPSALGAGGGGSGLNSRTGTLSEPPEAASVRMKSPM